jgi:hypothetical protein
MQIEGTVRNTPPVHGEGTSAPIRQDREGSVVVVNGKPTNAEAALQGRRYSACTAAAGVAPGESVGTTAAFALYNPVGSGVNLVVTAFHLGYVSGTLGAGHIALVGHLSPTQTAFTGTAITPVNNKLGGSAAKASALTTATVPSGGSPMRALWNMGAGLATTALFPSNVAEHLADPIVVPPGCGISLQGVAAAGTSPLVRLGADWEEMPVAA